MKPSRMIVSILLILTLLLGASPALAEGGKNRITKVKAPIVSIDEATGMWQIGEILVQVTESTMLVEDAGPAEVGAIVQLVFGQSGDEPHEAILIRVMSPATEPAVITLRGLVTAYETDTIVVNGMRIQILDETTIVGDLQVGALVKVEARVAEGSYEALRVQVLRVNQVERDVTFEGIVEAIEGDQWTIRSQVVTVTRETELIGEPGVGDLVSVQARIMADGSLVAAKIAKKAATPEPRPITIEGIIQRFPADNIGLWLVGGRQVFVSAETDIDGEPQLGAQAVVQAVWQGNGRLNAVQITIENQEPTGAIRGPIVRLPGGTLGRWQVGEWKIVVGPDTVLQGDPPAVGAWASVVVERQGRAGALVAISILVDAQDSETPEPTIPPRPDVTPEPTIPPRPDVTPEPDPDPDPDPRPSVTADPDPSPDPSPEPSRQRTKVKTPKRGTPTPEVTETPEPDETSPADPSGLQRTNI